MVADDGVDLGLQIDQALREVLAQVSLQQARLSLPNQICEVVFLVEEPLHEKIKTQITYAIGIIPVVLTIIDRVVKL